MAWGRHSPHTVAADQPATGEPAAEHPEAGESVAERPAHAWEFDAADSWEPVVPDTWNPPPDIDVSRGEEEWVDAAHGRAEPGEREWASADRDEAARGGAEWVDPAAGQGTVAEGEAGETQDRAGAGRTEPMVPSPVRMALGLASLAAQRMRGGVPAGDGLVTGIGFVQETVNGLRALGQRLLDPASRAAAGTVRGAALVPFAGAARIALRSRERLGAALAGARAQGRQTVEAGRADAEELLRRGLARALLWAGTDVIPRLMADAEAAVQSRRREESEPTEDIHEGEPRTDGARTR